MQGQSNKERFCLNSLFYFILFAKGTMVFAKIHREFKQRTTCFRVGGGNLCASASFYFNSQHAAWNSYWLQLGAVLHEGCLFSPWIPLAVKTKTPSGVCGGLVTCPGSIPVSRLVAAGRGLYKQPSRKKKSVFPEHHRGELTHCSELRPSIFNCDKLQFNTNANKTKLSQIASLIDASLDF